MVTKKSTSGNNKTGSFVTIADEPAEWTQGHEVDAVDRINREEKKALKKAAKQFEQGKDYRGMEQEAMFICPRYGVKIERDNENDISLHKRRCDYCSNVEEEKRRREELKRDTISKAHYVFHCIAMDKYERPRLEKMIAEKKRDPNAYPSLWVKDLEREVYEIAGEAKRALVTKHQMLNSDDPIVRDMATIIWQQYLDMSDKRRINRYVHGQD